MVPEADAGTEADLWFGPLVATRDSGGIDAPRRGRRGPAAARGDGPGSMPSGAGDRRAPSRGHEPRPGAGGAPDVPRAPALRPSDRRDDQRRASDRGQGDGRRSVPDERPRSLGGPGGPAAARSGARHDGGVDAGSHGRCSPRRPAGPGGQAAGRSTGRPAVAATVASRHPGRGARHRWWRGAEPAARPTRGSDGGRPDRPSAGRRPGQRRQGPHRESPTAAGS